MNALAKTAAVLALSAGQAAAQYRGETTAAGATAGAAANPAFGFQKDFNVDIQSNLADKYAGITTAANGAYDQLFNITGVAVTPLGQLTAWVGDLIYPLALGGILFFGVYILLQIVFQVIDSLHISYLT